MVGTPSCGVWSAQRADPTLSKFVSSHLWIHFLRPSINAATQTTNILQTVPHEIRRRIQSVLARVINNHDRVCVRTGP